MEFDLSRQVILATMLMNRGGILERGINFYKKIGAVPISEWTVFRLTEESIDRLTHLIQ